MMANRDFSSTEQLYYEGSQEDPLYYYQPESQARFDENVVFVPHLLSPVMLLEYVPVLYNFQTYEPYLVNRYQVSYTPFIRQVFYTYFVPYYSSYPTPEVFPSYNPEVFPSYNPEVFSNYIQNEDNDSTNSYSGSRLNDEATSEELSSSTIDSDETSVLSLSSSFSYNSYEGSDSSSVQDLCDSSEGLIFNENNDNFELNGVEEYSLGFVDADVSPTPSDCTENCFEQILFEEDFYEVPDVSSTPLLDDVEKAENVRGSDTNEASSLQDTEKDEYESHFLQERRENFVVVEDSIVSKSQVSDIPSLEDVEKTDNERGLETDETSSLKDSEKDEYESRFSQERLGNLVVAEDRNLMSQKSPKSHVSYLSLLEDVEKADNARGSETDEASSLKDSDKDEYESRFSQERLGNLVVAENSIAPKSHVSYLPSLEDVEKTGNARGLETDEASSLKDSEKDKYESRFSQENFENPVVVENSITLKSHVSSMPLLGDAEKAGGQRVSETDEASSLKDIKKDEYEGHSSQEKFENPVVAPDSIASKSHVSNLSLLDDVEKVNNIRCLETDEASSLKYTEKDEYESHYSQERLENPVVFEDSIGSKSHFSNLLMHECVKKYEDEDQLQQKELSLLKNENVERYDSHASPTMPVWNQEIPVQKTDSFRTDVKEPVPFNSAISEYESDNDGDLAMTLQDILASEEYWKLKREEYFDKRRNTDLYRSALERDIRPRRSLPEVGTMATIFEDLPYPINEPYDDGIEEVHESLTDEPFDLPFLEVERSNSSQTTLLPKKKRFQNTRKFFSSLFRCFRPPKMKK